jgi:hypothetical protein
MDIVGVGERLPLLLPGQLVARRVDQLVLERIVGDVPQDDAGMTDRLDEIVGRRQYLAAFLAVEDRPRDQGRGSVRGYHIRHPFSGNRRGRAILFHSDRSRKVVELGEGVAGGINKIFVSTPVTMSVETDEMALLIASSSSREIGRCRRSAVCSVIVSKRAFDEELSV